MIKSYLSSRSSNLIATVIYGRETVTCARRLTVFAFSLLLMFSTTVFAQSETRIGFVDIPYLIQEAPQAMEAERRLEDEFAPRQAELEVERERLQSMNARLADLNSSLDETEQLQLDRETRALERRIKRSEQDFREELNIQKNAEFKHVRERVLDAIARFGREHEYDLIVSDGVLYANESIDVTERILEALTIEIAQRQSAN